MEIFNKHTFMILRFSQNGISSKQPDTADKSEETLMNLILKVTDSNV